MNAKEQYQERVKFDFPEYKGYPIWDANSLELCLVYPLFMSTPPIYPEWHVNSAMWAANSWIKFSNLIEKSIPIVFYVENAIFEKASQQLMKGGVPEDSILRFETPERRAGWIGQALYQCLYPAIDGYFERYETVIVSDVDLFLLKNKNGIIPIERLKTIQDPTQWETIWGNTPRDMSAKWHKLYYMDNMRGTPEAEANFRNICEEIDLGFIPTEVKSILTIINAFCPKTLDPKFKEFIKSYAHSFGTDEEIIGIYHIWNEIDKPKNIRETWDAKIITHLKDLMFYVFRYQQDNHISFAHLMPRRFEPTNDPNYPVQYMTIPDALDYWKDIFYEYIGIKKEI